MNGPRDIDFRWASVYWTHEQIFGRRFTEAEMIDHLGKIAVDDALEALARLSCMVEGAIVTDARRQLQILRRIGLEAEVVAQLQGICDAREGGQPRTLFFPQQVVQMSRMAIRHCDRRNSDGFDGGKLAGSFIRCVFGVTDLLGPEINSGTTSEVRGFLLRQLGLMSRQESLYLFSRYYELLVRLWPRVHANGGRFEPAIAFEEYTGLSLEEYFVLGFATYIRFLNHVEHDIEPREFVLEPSRYFETTKLLPRQWKTFIGLLSSTPDELLYALDSEDQSYGQGAYRCHTFDRSPLVKIANGIIVPTSFASLERAVTEGAFWLLADAAEAKGLPREEFTGPFGTVFERFAQESLERIAEMEEQPPRHFRDFHYGPKKAKALSSDMSFVYEREGVLFEVVTGRPSVATMTRGNAIAFREDLRRLVLKKAKQLRRCWKDFFVFHQLSFDGIPKGRIHTLWPVLILIEGFPLLPPIYGEVVEQIGRDGWPRNAPRLTLLDADELGSLEALVEQGWTTLDVVKCWKRQDPELPMSNWLQTSRDVPSEIGHATWHKESFADLTDLVTMTVFGKPRAQLENEQQGSETA